MAVSLAKVADVDRSLGNEHMAIQGFEEGIKLLECLTLKTEDVALEQRVSKKISLYSTLLVFSEN